VCATIASIQRQTRQDWEVIVTGQGDDGAVRALVESVTRCDPRVRYLHVARRSASLARNAAMRAARGEIIAVIDDDCEARADWLDVLIDCFAGDPTLGLVGGAVIAPPPTRRGPAFCPALLPAETRYDPRADNRRVPPGWDWIGANFAICRAALNQVGLFDERLGPGAAFPAGEDTDLKLRLEAAGVPMRSTPRAVVYHTHGRRYGLRAALRSARNYAAGNAAVAAKLTLLGDPRGRMWLEMAREDVLGGWLRERRPQRLPAHMLRLWHFSRAYRRCLRHYIADRTTRLLIPRTA
jgi:GT2 family glycosyltransferase